jgi:hypothetical protein
MVILCLVIVVGICSLGTPVNALTMEECRIQYKTDMAPKGAARMNWHDYQVRRCGIDPNASVPTSKPSVHIKH